MITVFYSHGPVGLSCAEGQFVLLSFPCLEEFVSLMYAIYDSMLIDVSEQFDMLPVELKLRSENLTSSSFARCVTSSSFARCVMTNKTATNEEITQSNNSEPGTNRRENEIKSGK